MCRSTGQAPVQSLLWRRHERRRGAAAHPEHHMAWVFGINDGKDPIMPEHSVSQDAAVALRSTRLVLVNVPMLQLVRVRNECHSNRGAVPGFLIHFSVGVFPYLSSYTFYSAFSLPQRGRIRQDAINEEKPGNPVQSRKAQQSWQKDSTSLQNT